MRTFLKGLVLIFGIGISYLLAGCGATATYDPYYYGGYDSGYYYHNRPVSIYYYRSRDPYYHRYTPYYPYDHRSYGRVHHRHHDGTVFRGEVHVRD